MALTPSNIMVTGTQAPNFTLPDTVSDKTLSLENLKGENGTVVMFICNHCPFVIHINALLVDLAKECNVKGISFVAISSNDVLNYPQDAPDLMKIHAEQNKYPFPYLYDETQEIAKAYDAACTPDIYVFDKELKLHYHGQLDESRPGNNIPLTGNDIKEAFELLLESKPYPKTSKPSMGCNIKWK